MDELDKKIVSILQVNGRSSNAKIARQVGVSEGTVRRRLKRLVDDEIVHVVAIPDPAKIGYGSEAIIGIRVDPDKVDSVADSIAKLSQVSWVSVTTGTFDIFAAVTTPTAEDLGVFLRTKIGTISGVHRTETFVQLASRKRNFGVVVR